MSEGYYPVPLGYHGTRVHMEGGVRLLIALPFRWEAVLRGCSGVFWRDQPSLLGSGCDVL